MDLYLIKLMHTPGVVYQALKLLQSTFTEGGGMEMKEFTESACSTLPLM